ncbi:MAG: DUF354 domain-containing protein, partial [Candidatus Thermoplasmatota archaeon]|nr:DUF354 domain-containing protein [Candidatus Thermoplasmatota archaeon]
DINHPGHVHFFKHFIWEMEKRGHKTFISAVDKDVTYRLLRHYGIRYHSLGRHRKYPLSKLLRLPGMELNLFTVLKDFQPDLLMGLAAIRTSHISFFMKKPCISFDDTEHANLQIWLYRPFSNTIFTPECFTKYLGPKQLRYPGYHELAYLHPKRFKPNKEVLEHLNVSNGEKYAIIRFVGWGATHDIVHEGFDEDSRVRMIREVAKYARPIITSEDKLPRELRKYRMRIPPHMVHDALAFASMYLGEGGTMASEAALLGTPAIYTNPLTMGYIKDEEKCGMLEHTGLNLGKTIAAIRRTMETNTNTWRTRHAALMEGKIDVTGMMVWFAENYPESHEILKNDPDFLSRFK